MHDIITSGDWLPYTFVFLMGLSMLIYGILDGYDLGVGILSIFVPEDNLKDRMIASIGPFWDANETWLVLGVGLLLVAFPMAHGIILSNLYLPVALMLIGLIFRGVAFDFRAKTSDRHKHYWNIAFFGGSALAAFAQGYMLGSYIIGFAGGLSGILFGILTGFCLMGGYALIGAAWLIMKTEGVLQKRAVYWARRALWVGVAGILLVSISTPLMSPAIFDKWFSVPEIFMLAPIPLMTAGLLIFLEILLQRLPKENDRHCWTPFALVIAVVILCFHGLAYSFFPYIVPGQLKIVDAASAPESLMIILVGTMVVLPMLIGYTAFAYKVFWGKAEDLHYH